MKKTYDALSDQEKNRAPMVEIFGGVFALLMVLFVLLNTLSQASLMERLENTSSEGNYKIGWGSAGSGYVVITFPDELRIVETGAVVKRGEICKPDGPFPKYALNIYRRKKRQIVFTLLEGGVAVMAEARHCMMRIMPGQRLTIGWIIANNELLKSVSLDDIPPYIQKTVPPAGAPNAPRRPGAPRVPPVPPWGTPPGVNPL